VIVDGPGTTYGSTIFEISAEYVSTCSSAHVTPPPIAPSGTVIEVANADSFWLNSGVPGSPVLSLFVLDSRQPGLPAVGDHVAVTTGIGTTGRIVYPEAFTDTPASPAIAVPPAGSAYFGALVDPNASSAPMPEASQTNQLEAQVRSQSGDASFTLAMHMHYYQWTFFAGTSGASLANTDYSIADDIANHRIPVISWHCDAGGLSNVIDGSDDADIDAAASAISALSPNPVFVRWFWEFNLNINDPSYNPNLDNCFNPSTGETSGAQFRAAWEHIWQRFQEDGVTNAAWDWCPDGSPGAIHRFGAASMIDYFPAGYVDWVGVDSYDKQNASFDTTFTPFISGPTGVPLLKTTLPIVINETGVESSPSPAPSATPYTQTMFFTDALAYLTAHPQIRGFMYFDSPGLIQPNGQPFSWPVVPPSNGFDAFASLASGNYFIAPASSATRRAGAH
jgi:hypothetical protein